jgi:hypothetical protein
MMRFLIGFPLIMHGLAHLGGFLASWVADRAGFSDRPWILSQQVQLQTPVGRALSPVWLVALVGLAGSGVGAILRQGWWLGLATAAGGISLAAIVLWWRAVPLGAKLGAALDVMILIVSVLPLGERIIALVNA